MLRPIVYLTLVVLTCGRQDWEPCGLPSGCHCATPVLQEIQCHGITVFPALDDTIKPDILSLTIYNSKIVGLPSFSKEEWGHLKYLNFIDTTLLSCEIIAEIRRPGLHILSECIWPQEECEECTVCLASIIVLIILCTMALGFIILQCYYTRKTCPNVRETDV